MPYCRPAIQHTFSLKNRPSSRRWFVPTTKCVSFIALHKFHGALPGEKYRRNSASTVPKEIVHWHIRIHCLRKAASQLSESCPGQPEFVEALNIRSVAKGSFRQIKFYQQ